MPSKVYTRVGAHRLIVCKAQAVDLFMGGRIWPRGDKKRERVNFCYWGEQYKTTDFGLSVAALFGFEPHPPYERKKEQRSFE